MRRHSLCVPCAYGKTDILGCLALVGLNQIAALGRKLWEPDTLIGQRQIEFAALALATVSGRMNRG